MSILDREGSVLDRYNIDGIDEIEVLQRIRSDLHHGQLAFVDDQVTSILGVSAGYGAGKTRALCAKAVHLAMANQGFIGVVMGGLKKLPVSSPRGARATDRPCTAKVPNWTGPPCEVKPTD